MNKVYRSAGGVVLKSKIQQVTNTETGQVEQSKEVTKGLLMNSEAFAGVRGGSATHHIVKTSEQKHRIEKLVDGVFETQRSNAGAPHYGDSDR